MEKVHQKATLMRWPKEKLADYIIMLERNNNSLRESFDIQYHNCLTMINDMDILNKRYKDSKHY